jgi:hypothetical protein
MKIGRRPPSQFLRISKDRQVQNPTVLEKMITTPEQKQSIEESQETKIQSFFIQTLTDYLYPFVAEYRQTLSQILAALQLLLKQNCKNSVQKDQQDQQILEEIQKGIQFCLNSGKEITEGIVIQENLKVLEKMQTWIQLHNQDKLEIKMELSKLMISLDELSTFIKTPKSILKRLDDESGGKGPPYFNNHVKFDQIEKVAISPIHSSPQNSPPSSPERRTRVIRTGKIPSYPTMVAIPSPTPSSRTISVPSLRTKRTAGMLMLKDIRKTTKTKTKLDAPLQSQESPL